MLELEVFDKHNLNKAESNIFIVSTLLQLLGAIEAQKYFKTKNNILVFLFYGNKNFDESQLLQKKHLFDYDKLIIFSSENTKNLLLLNIALIKELKKYLYNQVFVGFFSANFRRFIANIQYNKLFLIDDGVYTIYIHDELYNPKSRLSNKYILPFSEKKRKTFIKKIRFWIFHNFRKNYLLFHGYKNDMKKYDLGFFTMFQLEKYGDEIIINHNFNFLKKMHDFDYLTNRLDQKLYFIGQPLERVLDISLDTYLNYLKIILCKYKDYKIVYIPHRAESLEKIKRITILVDKILVPDTNIELYLLENKKNLSHVVSFVSTALYSIRKLLPTSIIEAYILPIQDNVKVQESLLLTYKTFSCMDIKIIPLKD
ncbi:MAG: Unknown protein [uncultured Sulfurovum sp.]|uniref:Uncharacterized protein n=1 Tax=uncultured Sulfurovum sp. TaxID=269237 RepID=A0A6S6UEQ2_9BACT|nr:MAG: Unknown protein [uncultured Sulfurovum sp.]